VTIDGLSAHQPNTFSGIDLQMFPSRRDEQARLERVSIARDTCFHAPCAHQLCQELVFACGQVLNHDHGDFEVAQFGH
jgi:hypothetical protein